MCGVRVCACGWVLRAAECRQRPGKGGKEKTTMQRDIDILEMEKRRKGSKQGEISMEWEHRMDADDSGVMVSSNNNNNKLEQKEIS